MVDIINLEKYVIFKMQKIFFADVKQFCYHTV